MDYDKLIEQLNAWNEQHLSVVCGASTLRATIFAKMRTALLLEPPPPLKPSGPILPA